jgi:WD40 repeat protein
VAFPERFAGSIHIVPLDGSPASTVKLIRRPGTDLAVGYLSLEPSGRFVAMDTVGWANPEANSVRIVDLSTGEERILDTHPEGPERCEEPGSNLSGFAAPVWLGDGRLVTDGDAGLRLWNLASGTSRLLRACREIEASGGLSVATPDSRTVLSLKPTVRVGEDSWLSAFDLVSGTTREITSHGNRLFSHGLDASGTILVTGGWDGVVRVGPLTGEEPHLLFGHAGPVYSVAVSPDGRWVASGGDDGTIRLWPMPDLSKPPLHTLPHDELLAKLESLTNLRAVRDSASDTGWKIEVGPFPGWATVPTWNP